VTPERPWPLLAVGAGFLLGGAAAAWSKLGDKELSYALAAAGLIVLGAWLALESRR
jgi:membrane protein DedA with SNARE-associated domain